MKQHYPTLSQIKSIMKKIARENNILEQVKNTWEHSKYVWKFAKKIAKIAIKNGYKVDLSFLKIACFIHDLGRMKTGSRGTKELMNPIYHGYIGYKLALSYHLPKTLAEVCRRHLGGTGLSAEINKKFKFGKKSTFTRTIEEKILGYADCRTCHNKIASFSYAYNRFKKYPGQGKRLLKLQKFIKKITSEKIQ